MDELLARLEMRMRMLINDYNELLVAHRGLDQGRFKLTGEKEALLVKQQQVISQIEMLVSKLKTVEKWS